MKTKATITAICAALSVGCATQPQGHRSLVDTYAPGFSHEQYLVDIDQCNSLAAQRPVGASAANGAMGGLLVGALFGALVGSAYGDTGYGAKYGAALGTTSGAVVRSGLAQRPVDDRRRVPVAQRTRGDHPLGAGLCRRPGNR